MSFSRSALRYAHTNGYTGLLYTPRGEFIITCGTDGDIRHWTCISDDDPRSTCLGEFVMCIAHTGTRLLASTDRNTVHAYTFPEMDSDGILMRFTAPATCLKVSGGYTAAGSEDTTIKVLKGDTAGNETVLEGHTGPILALDLFAERKLLVSVAGDGQLKVWNFEEGKELKTIGGLPKVNSFESASLYGTPHFEPQSGELLAYAVDNEIVVLNTANWEVAFKLRDDSVSSNYSCCQFSPNGERLAAGTTKGEVSIFDVKKRKTVTVEMPPNDCNAITCLAWNLSGEVEVAFCDATGQLGTVFLGDAVDAGNGEAMEDEQAELLGDDYEFEAGDDLDTAADDGDGVSLEQLKRKVMNFADPVDHDDASNQSLASSSRAVPAPVAPQIKLFKQQTAFQPSATPADLEHRYMAWNDVGIVTAHVEPSGDSSIDVEFHDASIHHALHISNYNQHNLASVSSGALALASNESSKLVVIALAAAGNKEWSLSLPDCESAEAIVATRYLVAVATSSSFLRIFTVMGTQREVLTIPGPVVAIAGHEHSLMVVYHSSAPSQTQQHLSAMLVNINGLSLRQEYLPVPLTPGRQLTWFGYSDTGSPSIADNMGLLQLYRRSSNAWFPICDTMKQSTSVSHNFFVVAVSERRQIVQAVLCRGTSYPMTNPRPMLQELRMQIPLCDVEVEKSELEDALLRSSLMQMDGAEKMQKETAIKLFALACSSECETRARELIESIACTDLLQLAVKYATKRGRIHLSDRLCELLPQLEAVQEARKQQTLLGASGIAATIVLPMTPTSTTQSGPKPKAIELSSAKRGTLKRLANSPNMFKAASAGSRPSTPDITPSPLDTQENIFGESESEVPMGKTPDHRSPLNSVNPFAMKRKLGDTGVIFGSEKLKLAKK
ncbi:WD repeat and HMG-box DNA-binding protein 1 [Drosophila teissieri]|uniref:WD repeat and HMG-box DNA-binding protein 1 n=1 Tax=Drosophila teissieri TaxID=7243 RepID=UPI001CB9F0F5|nr:WD repeat and HMG-box DNA-binding protein 1 [Drosophila teissieri]